MKLADLIKPFQPADGPPPATLGAFFGWALKGSWGALLFAGLISALAGVTEVVSAQVLGAVVDATLGGEDPDGFFARHAWLLFGFTAFYLLLRPAIFAASSAANTVVIGPNLMPLVLSRLHRHTMGQPVTFFDNDFAGRIAQKQMQTSRAITEVATEVINTLLFALATVVGSALYLLAIDGRMALGMALWILAYLALIRFFLPRIRSSSASRAAARASVSGQVVDTITNIKTVKLFAHADHEDREALRSMGLYREKSIDFGVLSALFRLALMALAGVLPVMLIGGSVWLWTRGLAGAGEIAAAGTIGIRIAQMTGWVSFTFMSIYANVGEVEDGMRTLTKPHALTDAPNARDLGRSKGQITYENVTFGYGGGAGGVRDLTLKIGSGEKLGIVGASGAGKSTLVSLPLRLYDTEKGRVMVDGEDVRELTQESLRHQIAMVTQETALFNRSAMDNIRYGRPDATEAEVIAAAKAAEAHDFIISLRDHKGRQGYEVALGERGVKLSGGQRQRIALARAFLKNAPILVLDEATSALDSEVEAQIQSALDRVMEGKTVLAIAHRLSTIAAMDRIVVLDQGRIAEIGSHEELLAANGLYARYWQRQSGGFIGIDETAPDQGAN